MLSQQITDSTLKVRYKHTLLVVSAVLFYDSCALAHAFLYSGEVGSEAIGVVLVISIFWGV